MARNAYCQASRVLSPATVMVTTLLLLVATGAHAARIGAGLSADSLTRRSLLSSNSSKPADKAQGKANPEYEVIKAQFAVWEAALLTRNPNKVANLYTPDAVLLPTLSNKIRTTRAGIVNYFTEFLHKYPVGTILERHIKIMSPGVAMANGIYNFHFQKLNTNTKARFTFVYVKKNGKWLIQAQHSSKMPQG